MPCHRPGMASTPRYAPEMAPVIAPMVSVSPPRLMAPNTAPANESGWDSKQQMAVGTELKGAEEFCFCARVRHFSAWRNSFSKSVRAASSRLKASSITGSVMMKGGETSRASPLTPFLMPMVG